MKCEYKLLSLRKPKNYMYLKFFMTFMRINQFSDDQRSALFIYRQRDDSIAIPFDCSENKLK